MRFLSRSLMAVFLLAVTLALLALAAATVRSALDDRRAAPALQRPGAERVPAVPVVTLTPATHAPVLEAFGEVHARRRLDLRAPVGGRVLDLPAGVQDGAALAAGALVLRIDPADATTTRDLAAADLARAEAERHDAHRAVAIAGEDLDAARRQVDLRARTLTRQRDLAGRGVGAEAAAEEAELALAVAQQAVVARRQSLAAAEGRAAQADAALERQRITLAEAERRLVDTVLNAPFAGRLADVAVVEGGLVSANERIATLIDPAALEVRFRISSAQHARLLDGEGALIPAPVTVRLDGGGTAQGRLDRAGAAVGEGQAGRMLHAVLEAPRGLIPGDFVRVTVQEPALEGVARLPARAVDAAGRVLALDAEGMLSEVAVEVVRRQGDTVLVRAPDLAGAQVVAARTPQLGAGLRVRPQPDPGAGADAALIPLSPDRRAALIARVEGNARMPAAAKARLIDQLSADQVPVSLVARLEDRTDG